MGRNPIIDDSRKIIPWIRHGLVERDWLKIASAAAMDDIPSHDSADLLNLGKPLFEVPRT
jgi:hypothetical protein